MVHTDFWFLVQGFIVGFSVAAPIGPLAILCIRQTLAYGLIMGLVCGGAIAIGDGVYSIVAALGANLINDIIEHHEKWFTLFGGLLLMFIGQKVFRTEVSEGQDHIKKKKHRINAFTYTLILTLASPSTTLLFITMFTATGVFKHTLDTSNMTFLSTGVVVGAMTWWIILSSVVTVIKRKLDLKAFLVINKISGAAIFIFGLLAFAKTFF